MANYIINKIRKYKFKVIIFSLAILLVPSTAFSEKKDKNQKVVLQLRWNHQFQFAGYYAAKWLGYYEKEGLDVEIRSAHGDNGNLTLAPEEVASGRADFGIGSSDILLAQDKGADLCVVASLFQRSPVKYYAKSELPYESIVDFTKLKVARREKDLLDIELQAMLISEGIDPKILPLINKETEFTVEDLEPGKYDIIPGHVGGTIEFYAKKRGIKLKTIKPIDYGIDFYGDSLFTTRSLAVQNPELVESFRRASMKGWAYALEHPDYIIDRMGKELSNSEHKSKKDFIEYNKFQIEKIKELTLYPVVELGNINPYRWETMNEVMGKLNFVTNKIDRDKFIFNYQKVLNSKYKRMERASILFLILSFFLYIIIFLFNLSSKNKMLQNQIIERKQAENRIRKGKQRYEAIFNSAIVGIIVTSKTNEIIQVNQKWCDMIGYTQEELIGRNIKDIISEDGNEKPNELINKLNTGKINNYEVEQKYIKKNGEALWGRLIMTTIFDQDNETKVYLNMVSDITNRKIEQEAVKRSEKRFRRIINEVASEISQTDNIAELFNKENLDKLKYTEDDKNKVSLKLEKINLELEKMFKKELDENKRKEALIIHQAKLAAMGEMIGNIAHQWRQPLNSLGLIISNIEDSYMYNDLSNEYLHSSVQTSKKLISQMSNTIDDFRDFLKPKNKKEEFCLYECIVSVLELFEENLRFNNIKVIFENIVMENAFGYENQYSQAIFNIISNSIDALASTGRPDKKIVISIYLEDDKIVSEFTDNGGGIKEEIADRIFNPYFTTKKEKQGTGLGLYITKTIIENNMGGKVEWKNQEEGVSMKVSLPKDGGKKNL